MRTLIVLVGVAIACRSHAAPVLVGGPCQDCETVAKSRPKKLSSSARIAPAKEPGEPMTIDGVVRDAAGQPVAKVVVYAYHTDAKGVYPGSPRQPHGRLRGFAITAKDGTYHFDTIRPASYPNSSAPQHVHMHVIEPKCFYYIDEIMFTDDPLLSAKDQERARDEVRRGGSGLVTPVRGDDQVWRVQRDIVLGEGIADHDRCR